MRKDFTPSERVAIAQAIRSRFGERRGRPAQAREEKEPEEIVQKIAQFEPAPGEKTRQAVARAAGFGNPETLRQAEKVVEQGTPELVEAMDEEVVSIAAAAQVADLPLCYSVTLLLPWRSLLRLLLRLRCGLWHQQGIHADAQRCSEPASS